MAIWTLHLRRFYDIQCDIEADLRHRQLRVGAGYYGVIKQLMRYLSIQISRKEHERIKSPENPVNIRRQHIPMALRFTHHSLSIDAAFTSRTIWQW